MPTYNVKGQPEEDYECRLCVFETKDVPAMDVEGTSDVFIKAFIDPEDKYETDTHYRCTNGAASFNYRLLMKTKCPRDNYVLHIQIWDRDILKSNDMICSYSINLKPLFIDVHDTKKPI